MCECDNCKRRWKDIDMDMYNDKFCYECIDIKTGELKENKEE